MDKIDSLSDCSSSSRTSECLSSNISIASNLSEYQNEFLELRNLINPTSSSFEFKKIESTSTNITTWYEKHIENLNTQLQDALAENEKYKSDICDLKNKNNILYSEKIEKLLKQNKHLEENLSAANNQIQRLLSIHNNTDDEKTTIRLQEKVLDLEKNNHDLINQNFLLSSKINQCNFQKNEIESDYKNLKSEVNAMKLEIATKINSINELKKKISDQYVQLQNVSQNNTQQSNALDLITNELQHVKKSEGWYKAELQQFQELKNKLCENVTENEKTIAFHEETIEKLRLELTTLKCTYDEMHLVNLKEKERILRQLENGDGMLKKNNENCSNNIVTDHRSIINHYESVINDLTQDIFKLKLNFEHQQKYFDNISKEKSELLGKCLVLQNCLKEKNNVIEKLEHNNKELQENVSFTINREKKQALELLELRKIFAKLKIEHDLKIKETTSFEESVNKIREQFKLFTNKYDIVNNEIRVKNTEILKLNYEKQKLCIDTDQRICELKRIIQNYENEMKKLSQNLAVLEKINKELVLENKSHLNSIEDLNSAIKILKEDVDKLQKNKIYPASTKYTGEAFTSEITDILKNICELCEINKEEYLNFKKHESQTDYIKLLLSKIQSRICFYQTENVSKSKEKKSLQFQRNIKSKIVKLVDRCKMLETRTEENTRLLKFLGCEDDKSFNEIQQLQTLLQVKAQEGKDKQIRYEKNYRILLKKVKEHMKGRKTAEKHNVYLQELYNTLSNECNTLKLQLDLKDSHIIELKNRLEKYLQVNETSKNMTFKYKGKDTKVEPCSKCADFELLKKQKIDLEEVLKNYEYCANSNLAKLKSKEELVENLQNENEKLLTEIAAKQLEMRENVAQAELSSQQNTKLSVQIKNLENQLVEEKNMNEQVKKDAKIMQENIVKSHNENYILNTKLDTMAEKYSHFVQEIKHLSLNLQRKSEEVQELHLQKEQSMGRWLEKEANMQNLIRVLKNQVHVFKNEIDTIKNEKFFLQRLCKDLKLALTANVNRYRSLKEFCEKFTREKENSAKISLSNFPSPVQCDDIYIDKLLKESSISLQDKPFGDVEDCLNTLRMEILLLQKQIDHKNI